MAATLNIAMKFKADKAGFLNRDMIKDKMDAVSIDRLSKFGGLVSKIAKRSIRDATSKKQTSMPGQPPRSHTGALRLLINFKVDPYRLNVIIGPELGGPKSGAPKTLEYSGKINVEGKVITRKGPATRDPRTRRMVRNARKEILHGTRQVAARPYMHPAFDKALEKAQDMWKNSLR